MQDSTVLSSSKPSHRRLLPARVLSLVASRTHMATLIPSPTQIPPVVLLYLAQSPRRLESLVRLLSKDFAPLCSDTTHQLLRLLRSKLHQASSYPLLCLPQALLLSAPRPSQVSSRPQHAYLRSVQNSHKLQQRFHSPLQSSAQLVVSRPRVLPRQFLSRPHPPPRLSCLPA
jgi:hypothetical protein